MTETSDTSPAADTPFIIDGTDHLVVVNSNPGRRNALTPAYYGVLTSAIDQARKTPGIGSLILCGAQDYFCSGGDLDQLAKRKALPEEQRRDRIEALHNVIRAIRSSPKPVIAAVEGGAAGAGLSIALACDLIIAAEDAVFSAAYVKAGLVPDGGLTKSLSDILPQAFARRMVLFGDPVSARELARLGVVSQLVPRGAALSEAKALSVRLASGPQRAQAKIKALMNAASANSFEEQLDLERNAMAEALGAPEAEEGINAFLEKRKPDYRRLRKAD